MCTRTVNEDKNGAADRILLQDIAYDSGQPIKSITHINRLAAQIVLQVGT
jgi:hypothetical protein